MPQSNAETSPLLGVQGENEVPVNHTYSDCLNYSPVLQQGPEAYRGRTETEQTDRSLMLHTTTNSQSMMHLMKGMVGTGILAMPFALHNAGLWVGFVGVMIFGVICTHCMHQLVSCSQELCRREGLMALDYGAVVKVAFSTGPFRFQRFTGVAVMAINVFICITQFGFCTVYILFIADNIKQVVEAATMNADHQEGFKMALRAYQACVLLCLFPFIFIKNLRALAPFSMLANVLTLAGLIIILQYSVQHMLPLDSFPVFNSWPKLALYFGTTIYAFEGIGVVLPIENKMKTPEDFGGLTGVLNTAMVIVTVLYLAVGFYGYLMAGPAVQAAITLNLPTTDWFYLSVKLLFALAIFLTYLIQFYVPVQILWPKIERIFWNERSKQWGQYLVRALFLIMTFLVAIVVPHLDLMISLIGALASSMIALIFPPILELLVFSDENSTLTVMKNIIMIIFGFIGFLAGTTVSLIEIVNSFSEKGRS